MNIYLLTSEISTYVVAARTSEEAKSFVHKDEGKYFWKCIGKSPTIKKPGIQDRFDLEMAAA